MDWIQILLVLLCPIMMIFCMKGHLGGHKHSHDSHGMTKLEKEVVNLHEENAKLKKELSELTILVKKD